MLGEGLHRGSRGIGSGLRLVGTRLYSSAIVCLFIALMSTLGGCSLTGAVKGALSSGDPSQTFDLVLDRSQIKRASRLDNQVIVQEPSAVRALSGDNILVKPSSTQVTYFAGAVWSDRLPKLLQARMVEAIETTGRFRDVNDGGDRIAGDITLSSTIQAFQIEVDGEAAAANIVIFAKLIHVGSGKVYASRSFKSSVRALNREPQAGVDALNQAMNEVLHAMTVWVVQRGRLRMAS